MRVLNFGSLNLDYVYNVHHFVQPGETLRARNQTIHCGGKGLNQSIALARAGARVFHAGCIGTGGDILKQELIKENVDTSYLLEVDIIQGNAVIQVDKEGENCILLYGGSNRSILAPQVDQVLAGFHAGEYLLLQNEINCLSEIVARASKVGMRVAFNPSPFEENLKELDYGSISWLLVNEVEVEQLTGEKEPSAAWSILHERYPSLNVLITLGSKGAVCCTPEKVISQSPYKINAVDTTAAGDTFTGYFLASLMEGKPLKSCLERAAVASAISVSRTGASSSIPEAAEVDQKLKEWHERLEDKNDY